jgi:hypothetical protein
MLNGWSERGKPQCLQHNVAWKMLTLMEVGAELDVAFSRKLLWKQQGNKSAELHAINKKCWLTKCVHTSKASEI